MKNTFNAIIATSILATSLHAVASDSSWLIRLRGLDVSPVTSTNAVTPIGGHINGSDQIVPELDFNYFFNPSVSAELILATSRHSMNASGTTLGNVDLGKVAILPPTFLAQYHFMTNKPVSPYIGAGINYTYFYDVKNGPGLTNTHYGNSVGPALELGADVALKGNWSLNFDVKKLFVTSHVTLMSGSTPISTNAEINPYVVGFGFGYRFV